MSKIIVIGANHAEMFAINILDNYEDDVVVLMETNNISF